MKLRKISNQHGTYTFWCPGCEGYHLVWTINPNTQEHPAWEFNGDMARPTFKPSIMVNHGRACPSDHQCHFHIVDGQIQYASDCSHLLAGMTVDMRDEE